MNFFFFRHPEKNVKDEPAKNMLVAIREPSHNTREASEITGNTIRASDLPIIRTEESIAAGSPDNLL